MTGTVGDYSVLMVTIVLMVLWYSKRCRDFDLMTSDLYQLFRGLYSGYSDYMDLDPMLLHCITSLLYPLHFWGILKSISKKKRKQKKVEKQKRWKRKKERKRKDIICKKKGNKRGKK